jgi:menaquinone-dependent protoporphyrinogen IX oxidase
MKFETCEVSFSVSYYTKVHENLNNTYCVRVYYIHQEFIKKSMMLLRILRPSLSVVQSSRFLPGSIKLFSTTIKIEEFDYLNDYFVAVLKECRTNEKPMPWKSITPNLIDTLPVSKQNSKRGLNPMQVDLFVVSVLSMENEPKTLLDFVAHKKCEIFLFFGGSVRYNQYCFYKKPLK